MKHSLAVLAALATAISVPAAAEDVPDRAELMDWGYTIAGNPESDAGLVSMTAPLCLLVAAEDQAFAAEVAQRVIANAKDARIKSRRGKCRPNAVIAFADDALGQLQEVREKRGRVYGSLYASQLDRMLDAERDGFAFQLQGFDSIVGPVSALPTSPVRSDMAGALVVIDRAAAEGLSARQLADYATLRLLAPTSDLSRLPDDAEAQAAPTILTLFRDRAAAPQEMTRFDRAYFESLYRLPRRAAARQVMARASKVAMAETQP